MVNITKLEQDVIENGIKNAKIVTPKQMGGVLVSLIRKGLAIKNTDGVVELIQVPAVNENLEVEMAHVIETIPETAIEVTPVSFEVVAPVKENTITENIRVVAAELNKPFTPKEMVAEFTARGFTGAKVSIALHVRALDINAKPYIKKFYPSIANKAFLKFNEGKYSL